MILPTPTPALLTPTDFHPPHFAFIIPSSGQDCSFHSCYQSSCQNTFLRSRHFSASRYMRSESLQCLSVLTESEGHPDTSVPCQRLLQGAAIIYIQYDSSLVERAGLAQKVLSVKVSYLNSMDCRSQAAPGRTRESVTWASQGHLPQSIIQTVT